MRIDGIHNGLRLRTLIMMDIIAYWIRVVLLDIMMLGS